LKRAGEALRKFADILKEFPVDAVEACATEIVRRASNGKEFIEWASVLLGAEVKILPAEKEAVVALGGIMAYNPPVKGCFVTLDVGGGSTELVLADPSGYERWISLKLGVVDLAERVLGDGDPPSAGSIEKCEEIIRDKLLEARAVLNPPTDVEVVIGTGGTATSLAAVDLKLTKYDEDAVQNHRMSLEKIEEMASWLATLSFEERGAVFPLGGGREDVIIPGAIITRMCLETFGVGNMLVSDAGLLEGLALAGAEKSKRR